MNTQSAAGIGDSTDPTAATGTSSGSSGLLSDLVSSLTGSRRDDRRHRRDGDVARHQLAPLEPHADRAPQPALRRRPTSPRSSRASPDRPARPAPRRRSARRRTRRRSSSSTPRSHQNGKPYVWGSSASPTDPNPVSFDCSELTKWAAARSGVTIPDGAAHQYVWLKEQGATMSVQQALHTPGALLFHFASEPQPGLGGEPPVAHVAISLGNGKTIEAKGHDVRRRHLRRRRRPLQLRGHDPRDDLTRARHPFRRRT